MPLRGQRLRPTTQDWRANSCAFTCGLDLQTWSCLHATLSVTEVSTFVLMMMVVTLMGRAICRMIAMLAGSVLKTNGISWHIHQNDVVVPPLIPTLQPQYHPRYSRGFVTTDEHLRTPARTAVPSTVQICPSLLVIFGFEIEMCRGSLHRLIYGVPKPIPKIMRNGLHMCGTELIQSQRHTCTTHKQCRPWRIILCICNKCTDNITPLADGSR